MTTDTTPIDTTDFTDPDQVAGAVAAQVEDLTANQQITVLADALAEATRRATFGPRQLELINWMLDTATENNPGDEELARLQEKVRRLRGTPPAKTIEECAEKVLTLVAPLAADLGIYDLTALAEVIDYDGLVLDGCSHVYRGGFGDPDLIDHLNALNVAVDTALQATEA